MTTTSCRGRDSTKIQEYIDDPAKQKKAFVKALMNDDFLNSFNGQVEASECIFSYPDSEWYGVYLLDQDGNKYWNQEGQRYEMYYFKITVSPNKKDAFTRSGTTDVTKTDLQGKRACSINANGNCVLPSAEKVAKPQKVVKTTAPKAPKASAASEAGPSEPVVAADVMARLQTLSLNPEEPTTKEDVPREYFEQMKNKMLIVQWMVEKMNTDDLFECIKRGSLSPEDVRRAEAVYQTAPEEMAAAEAASVLPPGEVKKMFKRITKEDLISDLKKNFPDPTNRKNGIIEMCRRAGKKLELRDTKRGPKLFDYNGEQVEESDALDECATFEAERIRQRLLSRWTGVMQKAASSKLKGKGTLTTTVTPENIIEQINSISDPVQRKQAIVDLCIPFGFTVKSTKRGNVLLDAEGEQVSDQDALQECAVLKANTAFGKKRKRKSIRKAPKVSAKTYSVGTLRRGLNKKMWMVKKTSNGVKRWVKK